jgi:hypothetical protein
MTEGKRTCFEAGGHRTKTGKECRYFVAADQTSCPHHSIDKSRQMEILAKAQRQRKEAAIPNVETGNFKTTDDCLRVRAKVVEILCKDKVVDFRRLDMILKAATGASGDHATRATEEQNRLLLMLDGHGAGIAVMQRLRDSPVRVLPGKHKVLDLSKVLEAKQASPDKEPTPPKPTESEEA